MTLFCLCPYGFIKFNRGENFKINVQINCINFLFSGVILREYLGDDCKKNSMGCNHKNLVPKKIILFKKGEILNKTPDQLVWHNHTLVLFNSKCK